MPIRIYVLVGHANINSILVGVATYPYSSCGSYRTFVIPIRSLLHANTVQHCLLLWVNAHPSSNVWLWHGTHLESL